MYMEDITVDYIEALEISRPLKNTLYDLKTNTTNEHELLNYTETLLSKETKLYPDGVQINPKIIVLDNLELLNKQDIQFLFFFLQTAQNLQIMFILPIMSSPKVLILWTFF